MTKYREIIRLSGLGLSQTNIALSCNASMKKKVNRGFPLNAETGTDVKNKRQKAFVQRCSDVNL